MLSRVAPQHDGRGDQAGLGAVEIAHEGLQPALVLQRDFLFFHAALVGQHDGQAGVEEGELAQAVLERREIEFGLGEGLGRGQEGDFGAAPVLDLAHHFQRRHRIAVAEAHVIFLAVAPDAQIEPFGQRIDDRDADAMQAAGDLVGVLLEFSAGMQLGHDDFGRGDAFFLVDVDRNAAAIVAHGARAVGVQLHVDAVGDSRPAPRRWRCRPPHRPCGAGPSRHRCRRYTCRAVCARRRGP